MNTINLVYPDQSNIQYEKIKYPDGQQDIVLVRDEGDGPLHLQPVTIKSRFNSFLDLELISCTVSVLRRDGVREIHLEVPYFLGARSDRQFQKGLRKGTSYLADVSGPMINHMGFKSVKVLDIHSEASKKHITNLVCVDNLEFAKWAIDKINPGFVLVAPDAGSLEKIQKLNKIMPEIEHLLVCAKHRDPASGKMLDTIVPITKEQEGRDFVIVDDICDGGKTFIEIAKKIRNTLINNCGKIYLVVTHGIFSKGFFELDQYFDGIYCTNSYSDVSFDRYSYLLERARKNKPLVFKQLNVYL